jgi:tetratricopeptide (TPR) repeat protein
MLKRVVKMPFAHDQSEAFESAYLALAAHYIDKAKFDLAQDLCKRCLVHNKSSARAHETLGAILERECAYKDAAGHYEKAWQFTYMGSPSTGYLLAFNYLKAKRFVEAIDVANEVLKRFPSYPRIKQDVLDVAITSLKP